ncbi:MAG: four helix bundle protein [Prevotella sp.]|nr:four helix bundle protein [Prevotella sp.]
MGSKVSQFRRAAVSIAANICEGYKIRIWISQISIS